MTETPIKVEKRPGWDWVAIYQWGDEPIDVVNIFGAMSVDEALRDAHASLSSSDLTGEEDDYQIFAVIRDDHYDRLRGKKA